MRSWGNLVIEALYKGMPRSSANVCNKARIGNRALIPARFSSTNFDNSPTGNSVNIAFTGPIEAGDIEIERD